MEERERKRNNPFLKDIAELEATRTEQEKIVVSLKNTNKDYHTRISDMETLYTLSSQLRGVLLEKVVSQIQSGTNGYLNEYFDSELQVSFLLDGTDNLEVLVHKDGYQCTYKQLSKGQRQLLKLCFAISVQEAISNNSGTHFDNLWFDESLDGLSGDLKIKAYRLFEKLSESHASVMVIDHSEDLQNMFQNKIHVTLNGDISHIE